MVRNASIWQSLVITACLGGCVAAHCPHGSVEQNGYCVHDADAAIEGSFCHADSDCNPDVRPGTCDAPNECRGSRPHSTCTKGACGPVVTVRDDSACSPSIEANTC